jgi:sigma-E factor negative regulatory protein RseA
MKEQLSALIDGEFDTSNADHLLIVAKSDGELRHAWNAYHMIGDVMRGEHVFHSKMASRIMDALEDEPTVIAPAAVSASKAKIQQSIFKKTAFWSVAASVTAVMFVGLILLQQQEADQNMMSPVEIAENLPSEYLTAHQTYAPNGAAYYIQNVSYTEQR